jgi:hypothetical protein
MKKNMGRERMSGEMEFNSHDNDAETQELERQRLFDSALEKVAKPERGFLAADPEIAGLAKETKIDGDKPRSQVFFDKENPGRILARKDIYYDKPKGPDGVSHETSEIKSATERKFTYDEKGRVTEEVGGRIDAIDSWKMSGRTYDDTDRVTFERVDLTEGKDAGVFHEDTHAFETRGKYTKEIINITGKHYIERDGKRVLEDYTRVKFQYWDETGKNVCGWSQEYDKDNKPSGKNGGYMEWPEPDKKALIPADFKTW